MKFFEVVAHGPRNYRLDFW